ncbi:glycoside hydrolase superfamily, partial [Usnea florida]
MPSFSKLLAGSIVAFGAARTVAAGVNFAGVNIAGFDFGCSTDGTCLAADMVPPLTQYNSNDGPSQMTHFTQNDSLNIFRLPVAWQYLVNNVLGGTLDETNFGKYDELVQACLKTGAHCIIDIHNYARWNGKVIGAPGGPTASDFSSLWGQLAGKYKDQTSVVMGLMNEPHDIPGLGSWATSVQAAVTAIRKAGATTQMILLPGNGYTGASTFVSGGSAAILAGITNLDGSTDNLIFDVHQYLDSDYSGTSSTCVTNGISAGFQPLATWLQNSKRQALLSETGGGRNSPTCLTNLCAALDFLNENSASFLGWVGWAAGSFEDTYVLSLTPIGSTDAPLLTQCIA